MVLLSGEAGIGKTSLALEALAQLEENGWSTHVGYCIEFVDRSIPFGPIISILRSVLLDNLDHVDELIGHRRDDLAGLLPELTNANYGGPPSLAGDVDRLFDAITLCLASASKTRPLALLVEDIHWADAATRDLLTALVRNLGRARVLLVVTERTGSLPHALRTWLAEHRRMNNVHYLALKGLTKDALTQHAESVLQEPVDPTLVTELLARTGGNPYYCHELLVGRRDGNQALPSSLADFLTSRLARLTGDERELMTRRDQLVPLSDPTSTMSSAGQFIGESVAPALAGGLALQGFRVAAAASRLPRHWKDAAELISTLGFGSPTRTKVAARTKGR